MKQNSLFGEVLSTVTKYLRIAVIIVLVGICLSGIRVVKSGNVALILRFGKLVGNTAEEQIHEPGLLLAFPYIIDEVITVPTSSVMEQNVVTYYTDDEATTYAGRYVLTGDQNVATLSASVKYVISDPVAYALKVNDVSSVINACVSTSMLSQAANSDVDDLLTGGKDKFTAAVLEQADRKLQEVAIGVTLTAIELTQIAMPQEVRDVYNQVTSATVAAATTLEKSQNIYNTRISSAQGEATSLIAEANTEKSGQIAAANSNNSEFWGLIEEYKQNPEVVRTRLYTQKVTQMIKKIGTVKIVENGETHIFINP